MVMSGTRDFEGYADNRQRGEQAVGASQILRAGLPSKCVCPWQAEAYDARTRKKVLHEKIGMDGSPAFFVDWGTGIARRSQCPPRNTILPSRPDLPREMVIANGGRKRVSASFNSDDTWITTRCFHRGNWIVFTSERQRPCEYLPNSVRTVPDSRSDGR